MRITLKLFATLSEYLPPGSLENRVDVEVGEDETVAQVLARFRLPERLTHLVLVNGLFVAPEARTARLLRSGDQLAVWPPIAGG
jgi:sulfur carrier protein ThiS